MKIIKREQTSGYKTQCFCIKNHLYTSGSNADYSKLLVWIDEVVGNQLTTCSIYLICKNIAEHSSRDWFGNLESLMYLYYKEAVTVTFDIEEELSYADTDSCSEEYKEVLRG